MIKNYLSFKNHSIMEKLITESVVYYSPNFRNTISIIGGDISDALLSLEGEDINPDITFIDNGKKEGYVSFTTMNSAIRKVNNNVRVPITKFDEFSEELADEIHNNDVGGIYKGNRSEFKIGKFINRAFPSRFSKEEVENFVNKYKSNSNYSEAHIEIVSGDEIPEWYDADKHFIKKRTGTLGKSCMVGVDSNLFKMFVNNKDVCSLAILVKDGKLLARALVFKLNGINTISDELGDVEYYMDRRYYFTDSDGDKLVKYAKDNGWGYRTHNSIKNMDLMNYGDKTYRVNMNIKLEGDYNAYPFMDTFRNYDKERKILYNNNVEYEGYYLLDSTCGGYNTRGGDLDL
jgi:hypothetical protein